MSYRRLQYAQYWSGREILNIPKASCVLGTQGARPIAKPRNKPDVLVFPREGEESPTAPHPPPSPHFSAPLALWGGEVTLGLFAHRLPDPGDRWKWASQRGRPDPAWRAGPGPSSASQHHVNVTWGLHRALTEPFSIQAEFPVFFLGVQHCGSIFTGW